MSNICVPGGRSCDRQGEGVRRHWAPLDSGAMKRVKFICSIDLQIPTGAPSEDLTTRHFFIYQCFIPIYLVNLTKIIELTNDSALLNSMSAIVINHVLVFILDMNEIIYRG